jgi:hypothetical protein
MEIMQAGETLSSAVEKSRNNTESYLDARELNYRFADIFAELIKKEDTVLDKRVIFEDDNFIEVIESSYKIDYPDRSYLHVATFFHSQDDNPLDFGIHIDEHSEDGRYIGGLLYYLQGGQLVRYLFEMPKDEEASYYHFSIHKLHDMMGKINEGIALGGEEVKVEAEAINEDIKTRIVLDSYEEEIGDKRQQVTHPELDALSEMIRHAVAFPIPSNEEKKDKDL